MIEIKGTDRNIFIPYTGASKDVDLGAFDLTTTGTVESTSMEADDAVFRTLDVTGRDFSVTTASDPGSAVRFINISALDRSITLDGVGAWTWTAPVGITINAGGTVLVTTSTHYPVSTVSDLGGSGTKRWRDLWVHGDVSDGTNTLTVANAKTAFDHVTEDGDSHGFIDQDVTTTANVSFGNVTATGNTHIFQSLSNTITAFQILDADGGIPVLNVDTVNERFGIGTATPAVTLDVAGQTKITTTLYPVLDLVRDTTTIGSGLYAAVRLKRLMTGGTALDGSGITFYFETPDDAGNSTFAASFGAGLYDVSDTAEKGFLAFNPSYAGVDPSPREALKIWATGVTQYANTTTVNLQAYTAVVKPETSLQVETHASNAHTVRLSTNHATTDDLAGVSFGVHTSSTSRIAKSAIVHQRKGSWGRGDLVFLVDPNADQADVAIADEVMRLTSTGLELSGTAELGDGGTTNYAEVSATGDLTFVGSAGLPYACIDGTDETVTCTIEDTWYQVTFDTAGPSNNATISTASNNITILKTGDYSIHVTACFHSGISHDFELMAKKINGTVDLAPHLFQTTAVANQVENTAGSCMSALTADDTLELWVRCTDAAGQDAIFDHASLSCIQIGG